MRTQAIDKFLKNSQKIRTQNRKNPLFKRVFCVLVEPRGIEPLSENHLSRLSPSAARLLRFPSPDAGGQASGYGSRFVMTGGATSARSRSPLHDAPIPTAVLRVGTAA